MNNVNVTEATLATAITNQICAGPQSSVDYTITDLNQRIRLVIDKSLKECTRSEGKASAPAIVFCQSHILGDHIRRIVKKCGIKEVMILSGIKIQGGDPIETYE